MKKFLYKNRILLLSLSIPYILIVLLAIIKVEYDVTTPASIDSIENVIMIEDESELKGTINVVSVYSYERISVLGYIIGKLNPYAKITESYEYTDIPYEDMYKGGVIDKRVSLYNSIIAGYFQAGYDIEYDFKGYIVDNVTTYVDSDIEIGDIIISIGGVTLSNEVTPSQVIKSLDKDSLVTKMEIIKDGTTTKQEFVIEPKLMEEDGRKYYSYGFNVQAYNIPKVSNDYPNFSIKWSNINSIGPSGGLLQSFYVYEKLTGAKLSAGLRIAGTGTVDIFGNAGLIGGIEQKIITSELCNVDVFFIPVKSENYASDETETNYIDAMNAYNKLKTPHMKVVPVWSLDCIIEYLTSYKEVNK